MINMDKNVQRILSYFKKNKPNMYVKTIGLSPDGYIIICDAVKKRKPDDYITDGVYIMHKGMVDPFVVPLNVKTFEAALNNIVYNSK